LSQSTTYNIIFTGTNLVKQTVNEIKADIASLRQNVTAAAPTFNTQSNGAFEGTSTSNQPSQQPLSPIYEAPALQQPKTYTLQTVNTQPSFTPSIQPAVSQTSFTPNLQTNQLNEFNQQIRGLETSFNTMGQTGNNAFNGISQNAVKVREGLNVVSYQTKDGVTQFQQLQEVGYSGFSKITTTVQTSTGSVQTLNQELEKTGTELDKNNTKAVSFGSSGYRALSMLSFGAQMSIFTLSMLYQRQLQEENSLDAITTATNRYNEAVRESGAGSTQAQNALIALEKAQRSYNTASTLSTLTTVSMGLQLVSMGAQVMQFLPTLNALIFGTQSQAAAQQKLAAANIEEAASAEVATVANRALTASNLLASLTSPVGLATLAIGGVVGVGLTAGIMNYLNQPQNSSKVDVNVSTEQDILSQYLQRTNTIATTTAGG
jgi:hypothetical protein